ncbi:unnamed protein product [Microthlaspi erraticum]|uniref:NOG1 N-terminal helical domain-containing protein n=1 Tax=Microthlaspi erraticum TaxID=1685480 RepID=A0A6D2I4G0_9BRAS|nr:unnamed protein product [Microthlaspi erraticum]
MEMENPFKKMSVLPNVNDFADAIVSRIQHEALIETVLPKSYTINDLRRIYKRTVLSVACSFSDKLNGVAREFKQNHPSIERRFEMPYGSYMVAVFQLMYAARAVTSTANGFMRQMINEDCDSLCKFKCLLLSSLGRMFALAEKAMPSLAFLDCVRQYMASRTESNSQDYDDSDAAAKKYMLYLLQEGCKFPLTVDVPNVANPADPNVMSWLEDFKRQHGL